MSAICGYWNRDQIPADSGRLSAMLARMAHRAPDGQNTWVKDAAALGHGKLCTTPEALQEKLPFCCPETGLVITADARIDNRPALLDLFADGRRQPSEIGDSELILQAYLKWGVECPFHLLGDFAFAIWDPREREWYCARDHVGLKPFYYHLSSRLFSFGSEIKAIWPAGEIDRRINREHFVQYLAVLPLGVENTFFAEVQRLPPRCWLRVTDREHQVKPYWSTDARKKNPLSSDADIIEGFQEVFREAVRCRLRSSHPVGAMISGGLDSSSVACVARDLRQAEGADLFPSFSAIYDTAWKSDERAFSQAVLDTGGFDSHFVHPEAFNPLGNYGETADDEPILNPQIMLEWAVYGRARENNIRVVLDGYGGDDVMSDGFGFLSELFLRGRWYAFLEEAKCLEKTMGWQLPRIVREWGLFYLIPDWLRTARRKVSGAKPAPPGHLPLKSHVVQQFRMHEQTREANPSSLRIGCDFRVQHKIALDWWLPTFSSELISREAALFQVEHRSPFYDRRLMEYCLSVPGHLKLRRGIPRYLLRAAGTEYLPEAVRARVDKGNLSYAFHDGLLSQAWEEIEELVEHPPSLLREFVHADDMAARLHAFRATRRPAQGFAIWRYAKLARWLRQVEAGSRPGSS
jgi:asparagine synthase (glutamine-hydrolysing)